MSNTYKDLRGSLTSIKNIPFTVQEILVNDIHENVWKGFHMSPYKKRIIVIEGQIHDYYANPETGECIDKIVSAGECVDVPENWAHGMFTIAQSKILYLLEHKHNPIADINIHWSDTSFGFNLNMKSCIISEKDTSSVFYKNYDYVVLGSNGFLGKRCTNILKQQGFSVFEINERLENIKEIESIVKRTRTKKLICAAGISGKPTIDWCETHEKQTYYANFLGQIDIARMTNALGIHCTIFGSGGIYTGNKSEYSEEDTGDLTSKVYSKWRIALENAISMFENVLYLRIIYPVSLDGDAKCFLTKMLGRCSNVHDISVPLTVIPSMFPLISLLAKSHIVGIYNFVNKGIISLPELLKLYSTHVSPLVIGINSAGEKRGAYSLSTSKLESIVQVIDTRKALELAMKDTD